MSERGRERERERESTQTPKWFKCHHFGAKQKGSTQRRKKHLPIDPKKTMTIFGTEALRNKDECVDVLDKALESIYDDDPELSDVTALNHSATSISA